MIRQTLFHRPGLVAAVCILSLGGCAALGPDTGEILKAAGEHIEQCERDYQGSIGLGGSLQIRIHCPAKASPP